MPRQPPAQPALFDSHAPAVTVATARVRVPAAALCVLGSGSGGNCSAIRLLPRQVVLIDAGLGPRTTCKRLAHAGQSLDDVRALCVTHFDRDHFKPAWVGVLLERSITLWCHAWHADDLRRLRDAGALFDAGLVRCFDDRGAFEPVQGLCAMPMRVQHDRQGCIAYRFEARIHRKCWSIGYATDLGHAPPALIHHLAGVDLLCIESNYDEHMTIHSPRPTFVNRRNLSDSGHLSNEQAFDAVQRIADQSPHGNPRRVVLLHRSQHCNHPTKVRRCFEQNPTLAKRTRLSEQRRRTMWFTVPALKAVQRNQHTLGW